MGLITNLLTGERRNLADPQPWIMGMLGRGAQTSSGVWVNADTALRYTPIMAGTRIVAESIAMLDLPVYRRLAKGGKEEAPDHPLYSVLHDLPNEWQTSFEWREMMTAHALLRGNGYSLIQRRPDGSVSDLIPLNPDRIKPYRRPSGEVWYEFRPINGPVQQFDSSEMFHLRGMSSDGLMGLSSVTLAREAIGLGMAAEEYSARYFSNDATPPAYLKHPGQLKEPASSRLKQSWQEMYSGLPNAHKMAILEEGMDIKTIAATNRDSQTLETRNFQIQEVSRILRVPAHMLGDLSKATVSNIEQLGMEFLTYTLMPWLARWQQAIARDLFTAKGRSQYFAKFVTRQLLMGDMASRSQYYATMVQWGLMNPNEGRELEDFNPRADAEGKSYLRPMNMVEEGNAGPKQAPADPKTGAKLKATPEPDPKEAELNALRVAHGNACLEKAKRIVAKEVKALRRLNEKYPAAADFMREAEQFYREQFAEAPAEHIRESRRQLATALGTAGVSDLLAEWEKARGATLSNYLYDQAIGDAT
jgi:HK97 family phage portal protein